MKCGKYFLGGSSPAGHKNHFNSIISDTDYYTYIIKGAPGTGKSSLMKQVSDSFPDEDKELYYCSSAPESLDAILLKRRKVIIADGTAPHVFEAEYPGAVQSILNVGEYLDKAKLRAEKNSIIEISAECRRQHSRCQKFLTALAAISEDTCNIAASAIIAEKLDGFTSRFSKKLFPKKAEPSKGTIKYKQLSAITKDGYITHVPQYSALYLLNDAYMAGSELFLRKITEEAVAKGYCAEVSLCYLRSLSGCSFEHVAVPELNVGFISSNIINKAMLAAPEKKVVQFRRFYDKNIVAARKNRLKFNTAAIENISAEAAAALKSAKEAHDMLESYYISATDFEKIDMLTERLIKEIEQFPA
ncbi:MAG: hypothetical protein FWG90_13200 [Oscillospiraceae bacterium]|nr:hypothetical protein [Oscillospiraceae bacterium]